MSTFAKITTALVLSVGLAGCVSQPDRQVQGAAAGAAVGALAGAAIGGSNSNIAAGALLGGITGAAITAN
ncbi:MAG: bacteriocin [Planktotalea arctica]